jgi:predicted DNA-binding protein (MmcQ/YjbR family)
LTPKAFDTACRALTGVTMVIQWGDDHVYKVGGRIFAVGGVHGGVSFKASDIAFEALTETGRARPAPYLARAKWVRFDDLDALDDEEMGGWLATAHALVAAKLTQAQRREIGI